MESNSFFDGTEAPEVVVTYELVGGTELQKEEYNRFGLNVVNIVPRQNLDRIVGYFNDLAKTAYDVAFASKKIYPFSMAEETALTIRGVDLTSSSVITDDTLDNLVGVECAYNISVAIVHERFISVYSKNIKGRLVKPTKKVNVTIDDCFMADGQEYTVTELRQRYMLDLTPRGIISELIHAGLSHHELYFSDFEEKLVALLGGE